MIQITEYDLTTGECLFQYGFPNEEYREENRRDGQIDGYFGGDVYYIDLTDPDNPTPAERPASPVSRTDLTLLDVPAGSTLWINGASYPAEGTVELEFTYPGTYSLRVECFPFLDWVDEVTVP